MNESDKQIKNVVRPASGISEPWCQMYPLSQCLSFISNNGKVEVTVWSLLQFFTYYLHYITEGEVSDNKRYLTLARPGTTTQIDV